MASLVVAVVFLAAVRLEAGNRRRSRRNGSWRDSSAAPARRRLVSVACGVMRSQTEYEDAGLYTPADHDGTSRLELLHWLESLGGATAWLVPGRDRSRTRVVTTLLHGNEPSGFVALHDWLRSGPQPAVDSLLIVGNVLIQIQVQLTLLSAAFHRSP